VTVTSHYYQPPGLDVNAEAQRRDAIRKAKDERTTSILHVHAAQERCATGCEAIAPPGDPD